VAILHLLVALAAHYRAPIRLPERVELKVLFVCLFVPWVGNPFTITGRLNVEYFKRASEIS